jgi:hypothetical protein
MRAIRAVIGDTIDRLGGGLAGFLVGDGPLDDEDLTDSGEVEITVQRRGGPNGTAFDAPMLQGGWLAEIRFTAIGEMQADIGGQGWLVVLGDEQIMRSALDKIRGELALGQQRVGGLIEPP